jgi:hypothetical protein
VRPVALEGTLGTTLGEHKLSATAALIAANDTSGTLLTFRGWALHDRTTLAFNRQPLPPLEEEDEYIRRLHPSAARRRSGVCHRPGYYAKLGWQPPIPVRIELFRYDNRADPEASTTTSNGAGGPIQPMSGWLADLGAARELKAQAMTAAPAWVSPRTAAGAGSTTASARRSCCSAGRSESSVIAARLEAFDTRNRGSWWDDEYDENGWAAMLAGKREWGPFTGLVELLHVSSDNRERASMSALRPRQRRRSSRPTCDCTGNHLRYRRVYLARLIWPWCADLILSRRA